MLMVLLFFLGLNLALTALVNFVLCDPDCSRWAKTDAEMREVHRALTDWAERHGRYPESLEDLRQDYFRGCLPRDRFLRRPLDYRTDGKHFTLTCFGKDGVAGGDAPPDQDIIYTEHGRLMPDR